MHLDSTGPEQVRCSRNHNVVRYDVTECEGGHEHRTFVCPMRVGTRRCGETLIRPPYGPRCMPREESQEGHGRH